MYQLSLRPLFCLFLSGCFTQFFPDYLEVAPAVVVSRGVVKTPPYIDIVLIFFSYSGPLGILGSDRKQNTA